jgi:tetratricopeptide (TPR) repeat protein
LKLAVAIVVLLWPVVTSATDPDGSAVAREALALCNRVQELEDEDVADDLARTLTLADQAIAADDRDALAHFARFCALGEQARRTGASLSSLVKLWAIRDAVDRTLELAPEFPDALLGKGALLSSLPRLLGGDPEEGERLVRRALAIDPDYVGARLFLAETLATRGQRDAARSEAERAREAAVRKGDEPGVAAARRLQETLAASSE